MISGGDDPKSQRMKKQIQEILEMDEYKDVKIKPSKPTSEAALPPALPDSSEPEPEQRPHL